MLAATISYFPAYRACLGKMSNEALMFMWATETDLARRHAILAEFEKRQLISPQSEIAEELHALFAQVQPY